MTIIRDLPQEVSKIFNLKIIVDERLDIWLYNGVTAFEVPKNIMTKLGNLKEMAVKTLCEDDDAIKRVPAIKLVRQITGWSLVSSRDFVFGLIESEGIEHVEKNMGNDQKILH
jgi:ribosomal protein L7/L12